MVDSKYLYNAYFWVVAAAAAVFVEGYSGIDRDFFTQGQGAKMESYRERGFGVVK